MSKVYIQYDSSKRITALDGGYSESNISDLSAWTQIDEGDGDKYNLCQSHYLDSDLMTEDGIPRWEYHPRANQKCQLRSDADIEADRKALPKVKTTQTVNISREEFDLLTVTDADTTYYILESDNTITIKKGED